VAHIRLKKSPSRVKELILSDPPRIVFDLMFPEKELLAVERKARAKAEAEKQAKMEEKTEAAEPQKLATAPKPAPAPSATPELPKPAPAPSATPELPKPAPAPSAAPEPPRPAPKPLVTPEPPKPKAEAALPPEPLAPEPGPSAVAKAPSPTSKQVAPEQPKALAQAEPPKPVAPKAEPKKSVEKQPTLPPAPKLPVEGGIDWVTWGGVAAGVLVALLVIVFVLRRRALPNDLDVTALAEEEESGEGGILDGGFAMGEEAAPESMGEQVAPAAQGPTAPDTRIPEEGSTPGTPDIAAGPGLFDDEPDKENETMDTESMDQPMERTASELPTQMGAGVAAAAGESDIARLVQELERRVAQLETRLDEAVDARERLERQVAAQSEELRVQRAAIARTQRALRSLNRGEEEQATEPALREPSS
jgi:hypothetical protein